MTRFTTIVLGLTFVIAVAALILALWPVVADAPWEDGGVEATVVEVTNEEKEAERLKTCATLQGMVEEMPPDRAASAYEDIYLEAFKIAIENHCEY